MSAIRIVKRYANRKLYDTERSCYVTLEDISLMIKEGAEVKVVDNKSGEDLTTVTLAQIIFETEKKNSFMPLTLLRSLIQDSTTGLREQTLSGLGGVSGSMQAANETDGASPQLVGTSPEAANEDGQSQSIAGLASGALQSFEQLHGSVSTRINGPEGNTARNASLGRDMEEIRRRLAELGERLAVFGDEEG
jgi:polyhydroxyalkanoate synthesis repressor PhaR